MPSATCNNRSQGIVGRMSLITPESKGSNKGCFVVPLVTRPDDMSKRICCTLVKLMWVLSDEYKTVCNIPVKSLKEKLREHHTVFVSKTVILTKRGGLHDR